MRALILLSSLVTESIIKNNYTKSFLVGWSICWSFVIVQLLVFIPMHFHIRKTILPSLSTTRTALSRKWENGIYPCGPITLCMKQQTALLNIRINSWIYLYAIALLSTTFMVQKNQIHRPIILAAPFLLVTGSFFILSCREATGEGSCNDNDDDDVVDDDDDDDVDNVFLKILRRALRQTLFDVFQLVGENVAEDEKLQMNMLRWIVDYWATSSSSNPSCSNTNDDDGDDDDGHNATSIPSSTGNTINTRADNIDVTTSSSGGRDSSTVNNVNDNGGSWMNMNSLNTPTTCENTTNCRDRHTNQRRNDHASNSSSRASAQINLPPTIKSSSGMKLPSFNVDERARPAVESYKLAVEKFPPSRNACIIIAITKRCPALLSATILHLSGSLDANYVTIILLPMILVFEYMRISEWMNACHRTKLIDRLRNERSNNAIHPIQDNESKMLLPTDMEPMEI